VSVHLRVVPAARRLLPALSLGVRVPMHGGARVHSVFAHAANCELAGGRLVALLDESCPDLAHGIRIEASSWQRVRPALEPGVAVEFEPDRVMLPSALFDVDLAPAARWQCHLSQCAVDWGDHAAAVALERTRVQLRAEADAVDPFSRIYRVRRAQVLPALRDALQALDVAVGARQLRKLIGLGPGLTPAGDDFVVGCMAGLALGADHDTPRLRFLAGIVAALRPQFPGTTPVSRQHLEDACALQFSRPLAELAISLARGESDVPTKLRAALAVGATSGIEGVRGLLLAVDAMRLRQLHRADAAWHAPETVA
jgi:hypothetical protein